MVRFVVVRLSAVVMAVVLMLTLGAVTFGVSASESASVYFGRVKRKLPIYSVETEEKKVALTFDATWGADKTQSLLDTLNKYEVKATFFLVGFWVEAHSDMVRKMDEAGMEIGTHSNTHPHMAKLNEEQIKLELSSSKKMITDIIGKSVDLFRAPFGEYNDKVIDVAKEEGLFTVQWDVDSLDWKNLSAQAIVERILARSKNGSIVLMHNDGLNTAKALPVIIEGLQLKGFSFVTVGELIYRDGYEIDHEGRQRLT